MNKELAKAMIDAEKTSAEVAEAAGIHVVNFSKILRGHVRPSLDAAIRICYALGVTVEEVFGRSRKKPALEVEE
jgi:DNA-binding XRE family transcriptional regulator